jgi:DNA-binding winged helix-turn-helix (wHTH) protein
MTANALTCPCCRQPVEAVSFLVDAGSQTITNGVFSARFSGREFQVAQVLIDAFPDKVTKAQIYDRVFLDAHGEGPDMKIVDVIICKVRPKLAELGMVIHTVWGIGYRIVEEDRSKANAIREASVKLRDRGSSHRFTREMSVQLRELMARGHKVTACASIMKLPYMTVERAMKRIEAEA